MGNLPRPPLPTGSIELAGTRVDFHALSRAQAYRLNDYNRQLDAAEDWIVACATDCTTDEAHAWRDAVDWDTADQLVNAIVKLSGLEDQVAITTTPDEDGADPKDSPGNS